MEEKDIVDIYLETGDFEEAVRRSGLPALIAHIKLLKSGVLTIQDKINYSTEAGKLGAMAEERFQQLVPEAVDANRIIKKNNPIFDFMYGDLKIDVKYSSFYERRTQEYWAIRTTGNQDIIVAFLEREKGAKLEKPHILFLPNQFIKNKNCHISKNGDLFKNFLVEESKLKKMVEEYNFFQKLLDNVTTVYYNKIVTKEQQNRKEGKMRKKGIKKGESQKTELTTSKVLLIIALINLLEKVFDFIKTIIEKWGN